MARVQVAIKASTRKAKETGHAQAVMQDRIHWISGQHHNPRVYRARPASIQEGLTNLAQTVQLIRCRQRRVMPCPIVRVQSAILGPTGPRAMLVRRVPTRDIQDPPSALSAEQANTLRPRVRPPRAHARHAQRTLTRLPGAVLSRSVSAMRGSRDPSLLETCLHLAYVKHAWRANTKRRRGMLRARTAAQANTLRLSPLLQRALARRARQTRTRLLGVAPSRIALALLALRLHPAYVSNVRQASTKLTAGTGRARTAGQANTLRQSQLLWRANARRARQTRTHLPGVMLSRIVSAMRVSRCLHPAHVNRARRASTKPTAGTGRARTAGQAHTPRQSQLLPTAHARHALPIQMRQPGVMLSRIAAAIPATPESMVANAQSAWQASIRMFLDLVPVVSA